MRVFAFGHNTRIYGSDLAHSVRHGVEPTFARRSAQAEPPKNPLCDLVRKSSGRNVRVPAFSGLAENGRFFIVHQHSVLWNRANLSARVAHIGTSSQTSVSACQKSRLLSSRFLRVQSDAVLVRIDHSVEVIRRRVHWAGGLSDLSAQKPVCVRTGRILVLCLSRFFITLLLCGRIRRRNAMDWIPIGYDLDLAFEYGDACPVSLRARAVRFTFPYISSHLSQSEIGNILIALSKHSELNFCAYFFFQVTGKSQKLRREGKYYGIYSDERSDLAYCLRGHSRRAADAQ